MARPARSTGPTFSRRPQRRWTQGRNEPSEGEHASSDGSLCQQSGMQNVIEKSLSYQAV